MDSSFDSIPEEQGQLGPPRRRPPTAVGAASPPPPRPPGVPRRHGRSRWRVGIYLPAAGTMRVRPSRHRHPMMLPLVLLQQVGGSEQPSWRVLERTAVTWKAGAPPYEVLVEESSPSAPHGEPNHRIRVRIPGRPDFTVVDDRGPGPFVAVREALQDAASETVPPELPDSARLLLTAAPTGVRALLLLAFGYAYASDPYQLVVIGLDSTGYPALLFRGDLDLAELTDLDGDGRAEFVGLPMLRQVMAPPPSCITTYVPLAVYRLRDSPGAPLEYSVELSRTYNQKYYVWAGPTAHTHLEVHGCTPGDFRVVDRRGPE